MGKQLIQSQLGEDIQRVVFNFNCFDSCGCPFIAYSDSVDSDIIFDSYNGNYYIPHHSECTFDGFEVYRNKEKVLALFLALCIYCQSNQELKHIFVHFCLAHHFDMYKDFVDMFYNISINQLDIHNDKVLLWVLDIFVQYLEGNNYNFFTVKSLFTAVSNSILRDNFKLDAREQLSLRNAMDLHTKGIFYGGNVSNKLAILNVLSRICQIIDKKGRTLDREVIDYILKHKDKILSGLNSSLGSSVLYR